jgi:hypothetical protein
MYPLLDTKALKSDLKIANLIVVMMLLSLALYLVICFTLGAELQQPLPEDDRVKIRTAFYIINILIFPITKLIRYIQLRLNQTMPLTGLNYRVVAKKRYLLTVTVSMCLIEAVGVLGFVLFMLGDASNNLWILIGLSAIGLFLYRPKLDEYRDIVESLAAQS